MPVQDLPIEKRGRSSSSERAEWPTPGDKPFAAPLIARLVQHPLFSLWTSFQGLVVWFVKPAHVWQELHPDDLEPGDADDLLDAVCDATCSDDEEPPADDLVGEDDKRFIQEIFCFTRPSKVYESLFQIPMVLKVDSFILLTSTAHPSAWIAARQETQI